MLRYLGTTLATALILALSAAGASAAPPSPANPAGKLLGVVPSHHQATKFSRTGSNLAYHNGPVMHTNAVYAIYWVPPGFSVSANYESVINGFFTNVAAAGGATSPATSNVYYADTQYYDSVNGNILDSSSFSLSPTSQAVVDTNPFPASGCRDSYTSVCLTDGQIQSELQRVMAAQGWTGGTSKLYFMFTPQNVGSCSGSSCAYSYYCAYHSWIGSGTSATLYANMPYAAWVPSACGSGQSPNGDDADSTLNVTSHEHNESITDPLGNAWYDYRGYEDGDKCAWNFGSSSQQFGSSGAKYNQTIGTGHYYLQQEWSNHSSGCVLQGT